MRCLGDHQTHSQYLFSESTEVVNIAVLSKNIVLVMIVIVRFTPCPESESIYLMKFRKICKNISWTSTTSGGFRGLIRPWPPIRFGNIVRPPRPKKIMIVKE